TARSANATARPRRANINTITKPNAAIAAPAREIAEYPNPALITAPPSAAPIALPRLNAPMFTADARLGASLAASITRICKGGTRATLAAPQPGIAEAVGSGQSITDGDTSSTAISTTSDAPSVRSTERSAALPPHTWPQVRPAPNSTSMAVPKVVDAAA